MLAFETMLDEVITFYRSCAARSDEAGVMLGEVVKRLEQAENLPAPEPVRLSVARHRERALAAFRLRNYDRLKLSIAAAAPLFSWVQNPNYNDEVMGPGYMNNYGFVELVSDTQAHYTARNIRCGLLLLGPHLHYPPHNHEAEEVYHILSGEGTLWRRGDEDWRTYTAGAPVHHAPWMVHETRTAEEPLLALYCWMGDSANAKLV